MHKGAEEMKEHGLPRGDSKRCRKLWLDCEGLSTVSGGDHVLEVVEDCYLLQQ